MEFRVSKVVVIKNDKHKEYIVYYFNNLAGKVCLQGLYLTAHLEPESGLLSITAFGSTEGGFWEVQISDISKVFQSANYDVKSPQRGLWNFS